MKKDAMFSNLMELIKASLWGTAPGRVGEDEYDELERHAIKALPADILPILDLSPELYKKWKLSILGHINHYSNYLHEQATIPLDIPYVILKGSAAAQYYPSPEFRTMGDIDIMTRREDYISACNTLLQNGYTEITCNHTKDFGRHRSFSRNGIEIEIHAFFGLLNDPQKTQYLDDLIIDNINPEHMLPHQINGLVLLEHIDQHLEEGLGLRQIIDWMMFVDKYLTDEKWIDFRMMAQRLGLEQLAVTTTKMCEIYLGLSHHSWCEDAEETLCDKLMHYVMSCGNFGNKSNGESSVSTRLFAYARTPAAFFRLLQERGLVNWEAAQKYRFLRPFAWIYQFGRYQRYSFGRKNAHSKIKEELREAKERISLFDALGVKQVSKGIAVYDKGKYYKTFMRP